MAKEHKGKHTSIRFKDSLLKTIDLYALFQDITRNEAIEELIERGIAIMANFSLLQKLRADLESRWLANAGNLPTFKMYNAALIMKRDNNKCQKCETTTDLEIFHINKNPTDFDVKNVITLCHSCSEKAKVFIANEYVQESFAVWFFLTKDF